MELVGDVEEGYVEVVGWLFFVGVGRMPQGVWGVEIEAIDFPTKLEGKEEEGWKQTSCSRHCCVLWMSKM